MSAILGGKSRIAAALGVLAAGVGLLAGPIIVTARGKARPMARPETWTAMRTHVLELLPMGMKAADMVPDNPGTWLYHWHVNDHIDAGMIALFYVE